MEFSINGDIYGKKCIVIWLFTKGEPEVKVSYNRATFIWCDVVGAFREKRENVHIWLLTSILSNRLAVSMVDCFLLFSGVLTPADCCSSSALSKPRPIPVLRLVFRLSHSTCLRPLEGHVNFSVQNTFGEQMYENHAFRYWIQPSETMSKQSW